MRIRDPGLKKFGSVIRDKHPGFASDFFTYNVLSSSLSDHGFLNFSIYSVLNDRFARFEWARFRMGGNFSAEFNLFFWYFC
jgi:hypothetical protein